MMAAPPLWQAPNLLALGAQLRHGFFGRRGGVSGAPWTSLNCGFGSRDARRAVAANRARVAAALGAAPAALVTPHQSHSADVVLLTGAPQGAVRADALVTQARGLAIGVLAADCAPVLLCDVRLRTIAAIHAGWRGAAAGVVERTLARLEALGAPPSRLHAAVGPCIGAAAYEVGEDMRAQFCAQSADGAPWFSPRDQGRYHFDLRGFLAMRLRRAKVRSCSVSELCTLRDGEQLFSFRRSRAEKTDYGRQISALCLHAPADT